MMRSYSSQQPLARPWQILFVLLIGAAFTMPVVADTGRVTLVAEVIRAKRVDGEEEQVLRTRSVVRARAAARQSRE